MHNHASAKQQYEASRPMREDTVAPFLPQRQTRRRASFRERLWTKTSTNFSSDSHDGNSASTSHQEPQGLTTGRSVYVPVNAASGFSRTVSAAAAATARHPSPPHRRAHLAAVSEQPQEKHEEQNASTASSPPAVELAQAEAQRPPPPPPPHNPELDCYYNYYSCHSHLRAETDDYAAFIAAAEADDRARHAEWRGSSSHSKLRDSGYCSSFGGGRHREPYVPLPSPVATATRTLRRQQSFRTFGRRIAEYVKPTRAGSGVGSRVRELHEE